MMSNSQGAQSPEPDSWSWITWSQQSVSTCVSSLKLGLKKTHKKKRKFFPIKSSYGRENHEKCPSCAPMIHRVDVWIEGNTPREGELWSINRQLKSPHLLRQTRLPSFPDWKRAEAAELSDWLCRWGRRTDEEKSACVGDIKPERWTYTYFFTFRIAAVFSYFFLELNDPAAVRLLSLRFWISKSKSCWLIPVQSQAQSSHLTWAKKLSWTWIWSNTWSLPQPRLLVIPSSSW